MDKSNLKSLELPIISEHNEENIDYIEKKDLKQIIKEYHVSRYDELCGDYAKIEKLIPIKTNNPVYIFYILINIITFGIFSFFFVWFPTLKLIFIYKPTTLSDAKYIAIYGKEGEFTIKKFRKTILNNTEKSFQHTDYDTNIPFNAKEIYHFNYKFFRYIYITTLDSFQSIKYKLHTSYKRIHRKYTQGLYDSDIEIQRKIFGECNIKLQIGSYFKFLYYELGDPFYLFDLFSIILWYKDQYEIYATIISFTTILSIITNAYESRKNQLILQKLARYSCSINVIRKNENGKIYKKNISSKELVPGDLFEIPEENQLMPCDAILLSGTVFINEAMITGENNPIKKNSIPNNKNIFIEEKEERNFLFSGTQIIQKIPKTKNGKVYALVDSTGFNTWKGNLIRATFFSENEEFEFINDSQKYILFMGFVAIIGLCIAIPFLIKLGETKYTILIRSLDLITTTVPPSLPTCLGIGNSLIIARLRKQGIICRNKFKLYIAGKINTLCLDKTGTLTEDKFEIYGFRPIYINKEGNFCFCDLEKTANKLSNKAFEYYKQKDKTKKKNKNEDLNQFFIECIATCHSATKYNGKIIGNQLDLKILESSKWKIVDNDISSQLINTYIRPIQEINLVEKLANLKENEDDEKIISSHYELGIIRSFAFSSTLQRMSVIVKDPNEDYYKIFCKGSPQKIKELCLSETIPDDFNEILKKYSTKGLRVNALGMKLVKMSYLQSQQVKREKIENNFIFLGLVIFKNKLKEATKETISILDDADIKMLMVTGDYILTAVSVARQCGLIDKDVIVHTCDINDNKLIWNTIGKYDDDEDEENNINDNENSDLRRYSINSEIILNATNGENDLKNSFLFRFPPENLSLTRRQSSSNNPNLTFGNTITEINSENIENNLINISESIIERNNENRFENNEENNKEDNNINQEIKQSTDYLLLNINLEEYPFGNLKENYIMAINGKTFDYFYNFSKKYKETHDLKYKVYSEIFKSILQYGKIYAGMEPEQKGNLIQSLKDENLTVCMCGDGANDNIALRTADVGVSLSKEESSIAASFTSIIPDISCLPNLLKECKSSLVNSIQIFKFMIMYSIIQFLTIICLIRNQSFLTNYQSISVDIFIVLPLASLYPLTEPYGKLTHHKPSGNLVSFPIIISILFQSIISFVFLIIGLKTLKKRNWYHGPMCKFSDIDVYECPENTVIFLIGTIEYLTVAYVFIISKPFKKNFYTNIPFTIFILAWFIYGFFIILNPDDYSMNLLSLFNFSDILKQYSDEYFNIIIFIICVSYFIVSFILEKFVVPILTNLWNKRKIKELEERENDPQMSFSLGQLQKLRSVIKYKN